MRSFFLLGLASILATPAAQAMEVRTSAQRGLDFLVRSSKAWTAQHKCYGCHVQAVTLEGLTVGRHNRYRVDSKDLKAMTDALMLGVTAGGRKTGAAFQGAAWARYDQWIDGERTEQLLRYARELIRYQNEQGAVEDDDRRPPVVAGTMQTTFQAMQTWRQAYARTADDVWLGPMRKAEGYLTRAARRWKEDQRLSILDLNYALMGLVAAGVKSSEPTSRKLQKMLLARQNQDGGFGLEPKKSDALATGQSLYALKLAGYDDRDPTIARGMRYLTSRQQKDGSWRTVRSAQNGAERGEAMWAVLGLVSVDVMSIAVEGVRDGQRVDGAVRIDVEATDNQGSKISKLELLLDDLPVAAKSGARLSRRVDVKGLQDGKHFIDVVATNEKKMTSRRRLEIYTGDIFMTHVGARFDEAEQLTEISLRNIAASAATAGKIRFEVLTDGEKPKRVFEKEIAGTTGAMTIPWKGETRGRYVARISFLDAKGKVRQSEKVLFFHDSARVQQEKFGEIQGRIGQARGGASFAANAMVELVDRDGRVVQTTRSTDQGNYRFKNVDKGKYKVRVKKRGFEAAEAEVTAAPASAPARADMHLH